MKRSGCIALRYAAVFFGLIALFTTLMTLVCCIPQEKLAYKHETSAYILDMEEEKGVWFGNFFGVEASRLDNTTDSLMIDEVALEEEDLSPLERAMSVGGYSRYWHGYLALLRPLMTFLDYWQIRYVNMFVFFLLTGAVMLAMQKILGGGSALAFMASLTACYIVILPVSLQYNGVFLVMLAASLLLLRGRMTASGAPLFFMAVGMATNFLDFLTAPLLTLGMPLLLLLERDLHGEEVPGTGPMLARLLSCSAAWAAGYALCWVSKWVIGSLVLGESVFSSAGGSAAAWLGNDWGQYGRLIACKQNFEYFFLAHGKRVFFPLIPLALAYIYCLARFPSGRAKRAWVLLIVCLYPYAWYMTLANHSLFHTWFTNRLQAMTLFGALLFLLELVDWRRAAQALRAKRRRA